MVIYGQIFFATGLSIRPLLNKMVNALRCVYSVCLLLSKIIAKIQGSISLLEKKQHIIIFPLETVQNKVSTLLLPEKILLKPRVCFLNRSVGLPQALLNQVEGERPASPMFTEAQQFVLSDVQTYFKSFFKVITTI